MDLRQGVLGANITVRGALQCISEFTPEVDLNISLQESGSEIVPVVTVNHLELDLHRICVPGAVEAGQAYLLLDPVAKIIVDQIADAVNGQLRRILSRQVREQASNINLMAHLRHAVEQADRPAHVATDIWLMPNAESVSITGIEAVTMGGVPTLSFAASIRAHPEVHFGDRPPVNNPHEIAVHLGSEGHGFQLAPRGVIPLAAISSKLRQEVQTLVAERYPRYRSVDFSVETYQSNDRLVFSLTLRKVGPLKSSGTLFLSAVPVFEQDTRQIAFQDIQFDVKTREFLVRTAAWLLDARIERYLEGKLKFGLGPQLDRLLNQYANFSADTGFGRFSGHLNTIRLGDVWVDQDRFQFTLISQGTAQFEASIPSRN